MTPHEFPASDRWFRRLLRFYPADFRGEVGDAIVDTYRDRVREAFERRGWFGVATTWLTAFIDSLRNGLSERLRPAVTWRRHGDWGRDLEIVGRRLRQRPMFVLGTVATLTIGLGTFAVVYTAVDKILLEPLPYVQPEDLYMVWRKTERFVITGPEASELQKAGGVIERAGIFRWASFALAAGTNTDAMRLQGMSVSPSLFDVLGVLPALGRTFSAHETGPDSPNVVILSDSLWRRLGSSSTIVGSEVRLGATPFTVIGVMPPSFRFAGAESDAIDAYVPLYDDLPSQPPLVGDWMALVRARHGTAAEVLDSAVDRIGNLVDVRVNGGKKRGLRAIRLQDDLSSHIRPALIALAVATAFLVVVLTLNLASLLLARAVAREKEFAVVRALGADDFRVVRATLAEGAVLGLTGGVLATAAGIWGVRLLVEYGPGGGRMRRTLVVVQVALALVLLNAGGLLVKSFDRLLASDPGFRPQGVVTFGVGLGKWLFPQNADSYAFQDRVTAAVAALPGVRQVSATTTLPMSGGGSISWIFPPQSPKDGVAGYRIFVRAGYPETIGMRLIAGRTFETARHPDVHEALIDRELARHLFGRQNPLGATFNCDDRVLTVIGVVEQPRIESLHRSDSHPQVFLRAEDYPDRPWRFVVHTDGDPHALLADLQVIVRRIDRRVPVSDVKTLDDIVADRRSRERTSAVVVTGLAVGALMLVAVGLFGMVSGTVAYRRGELAVRLALGATHQRILRLVVGDGARLVVAGMLLSVPGLYLAGQALEGLLVETSPFDASTLAIVGTSLIAVTVLASYLAARPVSTIEPDRLLRDA